MKTLIPRLALSFLTFLLLVSPGRAEKQSTSSPASAEDFFLVTSVDPRKKQLVLKRPTEVTELVRVTEKTTYLDEQGKAIAFKDLRAGDTIYVVSSHGAEGVRLASRIRKGPMTLDELRRRYLGSR